MKKVLFVAFMVMAFVALGSMAAFACGEHKASKTADASKVDAKQVSATTTKDGCSASKASTTNASMASSSTTKANGASCSVADKAACAAKMAAGECSIEDCLKACEAKHAELCGETASAHFMTAMSIKGMTCGGCESGVKTALMSVEGVNNVIDVCHKAGFAVVCTGKSDFNNQSLVKAVTAKGYESEIIPAVSVTTNEPAKAEKAECSAHKKDGSK